MQVNLPSNPARRRGEVQGTGQGRSVEVDRQGAGGHGDAEPPQDPGVRWIFTALVQLVLALALLAGGYGGYRLIVDSAPRAERAPPKRVARLVEVVPAAIASTGPVIEAWGQAVAAQTLVVRPEISGTLDWVADEVTPGGRLGAGQEVARFDTRDLKLALAQAENAVAQIDARIQIEKGQAEIGKREVTRLSRNLTDAQRALVLREPQMASLLAERAAAVAVRDQARNALTRAVVRAPFDGLVISENVAPGAMLAQGAEAATIVASDRFHVTLAVPARALQWLRFDGTQTVMLSQPGLWPEGESREGRILRLNSALTEKGRMAEVIVEIPDPLALSPENAGRPPVLLGSFVRGVVVARPVEGAILLDRAYLRDGDTVWVMGGDDRLEVRAATVAWRGADSVLVTGGLAPGDRVVTTTLATHAPGMALRTRGEGGGSADRQAANSAAAAPEGGAGK